MFVDLCVAHLSLPVCCIFFSLDLCVAIFHYVLHISDTICYFSSLQWFQHGGNRQQDRAGNGEYENNHKD